jgi:hypothetical protein
MKNEHTIIDSVSTPLSAENSLTITLEGPPSVSATLSKDKEVVLNTTQSYTINFYPKDFCSWDEFVSLVKATDMFKARIQESITRQITLPSIMIHEESGL